MKALKYTANALIGFLFQVVCRLGFLLATNSSKGWDVANPDADMFIPFGIILLILAFAWLVLMGIRIIRKKATFVEPAYFAFGFLLYEVFEIVFEIVYVLTQSGADALLNMMI